jgi:hypothetical protein
MESERRTRKRGGDPHHAFASMSLDSNHRSVNPTNFLMMKDNKPPIVETVKIPGNKSFQTSKVVTGFCVLAKRNDETKPCLRSIGTSSPNCFNILP